MQYTVESSFLSSPVGTALTWADALRGATRIRRMPSRGHISASARQWHQCRSRPRASLSRVRVVHLSSLDGAVQCLWTSCHERRRARYHLRVARRRY